MTTSRDELRKKYTELRMLASDVVHCANQADYAARATAFMRLATPEMIVCLIDDARRNRPPTKWYCAGCDSWLTIGQGHRCSGLRTLRIR